MRTHRTGFALIELVVLGNVVVTLILLLVPAMLEGRTAARRAQCKNNLKMLGLALHNYHDVYNTLPFGRGGNSGKGTNEDMMSGMVSMLPFLDHAQLYNQIMGDKLQGGHPEKETYPNPVEPIESFLCPDSSFVTRKDAEELAVPKIPMRSYCFSAGDDTRRDVTYSKDGKARQTDIRGLFGFQSSIRFRAVTDGTSNTIAVMERDLGIRTTPHTTTLHGVKGIESNPSLCQAAVVDGKYVTEGEREITQDGLFWASNAPAAWYVNTVLPPNGPACVGVEDKDRNFGVIRAPSSRHAGGVQVLLLDGSVRFISEHIAVGESTNSPVTGGDKSPYGSWGALGSYAGGEVLQNF